MSSSKNEESDLFSGDSKAHGSTFDDLFGEGSSKKGKKDAPKSHGTTFDDLFGDDLPASNISSSSGQGNTYEDFFSDKSLGNESVTFDDLFGDTSKSSDPGTSVQKLSSKDKAEKSHTDDLLSVSDDVQEEETKVTSDSTSAPAKSGNIFDELDVTDSLLFGAPSDKDTKSGDQKDEDLLGLFVTDTKKTPEKAEAKDTKTSLDDLFGVAPKEKPKSELDSVDDIFASSLNKPKQSDDWDDLFGSPSTMSASTSAAAKADDKGKESCNDLLDGTGDLLGDFETKSVDTTKNGHQTGKSTEVLVDVTVTSEIETERKDSDRNKVEAKVEEEEEYKSEPKGSLTNGTVTLEETSLKVEKSAEPDTDIEVKGDAEIDFDVIQDTSLLDPNITRHKSSLRKRSSLAHRKKPTRNSIRRVFHESEDQLTLSSNGGQDVDDESDTEIVEKQEPPPEEETPKPKKSPVAGGKLLIGPSALLQSELMKGIASRKSKTPVSDTDKTTTNGIVERASTTESKTKPLTKPSKPQVEPRLKASPKPSPSNVKPPVSSISKKPVSSDVMPSTSSDVKSSPSAGVKSSSSLGIKLLPSIGVKSSPVVGVKPSPSVGTKSTDVKPSNVKTQPSEEKTSDDILESLFSSAKASASTEVKISKTSASPEAKMSAALEPSATAIVSKDTNGQAPSTEDVKSSSLFDDEVSKVGKKQVNVSDSKGTDKNGVLSAKPSVPTASGNKGLPETLGKVTLRSTRAGSIGESKEKVPSENKSVSNELAEMRNALRRVSPTKPKVEEKKVEEKYQPSWLAEKNLKSTPRTNSNTPGNKLADSKLGTPNIGTKQTDSNTSLSKSTESKVMEGKPKPAIKPGLTPKPTITKPKPKIEAKPTSVNGSGDSTSKSTLKDSNTDLPAWKQQLFERNKKNKEESPVIPSKPVPSSQNPDVAANWRAQLSQKKRKPVSSGIVDTKAAPESNQPEWIRKAEQRRARLVNSGILEQKKT